NRHRVLADHRTGHRHIRVDSLCGGLRSEGDRRCLRRLPSSVLDRCRSTSSKLNSGLESSSSKSPDRRTERRPLAPLCGPPSRSDRKNSTRCPTSKSSPAPESASTMSMSTRPPSAEYSWRSHPEPTRQQWPKG